MSERLARMILALAARCLGPRRQEWAAAMDAELDAVIDAGDAPLPFVAGCLWGAVRTMGDHPEDRFSLVAHALALATVIPVAAILSLAAMLGFPMVDVAGGMPGLVSGAAGRSLLNAGTFIAAPSLTLVMLALAVCELRAAWAMLDRDWAGVAAAGRMATAALTTLLTVALCIGIDPSPLLAPAVVLAVQAAMTSELAAWHARLIGHERPEGTGTA
jgi:hypothetical protein